MVALLSLSCETGNTSWVGKMQADLIASKGAPTQVMDDGRGGKVWLYEKHSDVVVHKGTTYLNSRGEVVYVQPDATIAFDTIASFFIGPDGIIYDARQVAH